MKNIFLIILITFLSGCVRPPYTLQGDLYPSKIDFEGEPQISRGEPNVVADGLGHYLFSLPEKLVLWNWNMGSHNISPETEAALQDYLAQNELKEVKVRLNEYAPFSEFHRLINNEGVGPGWRYSIGLITWVLYTVLPGRILGGDNYNPWSNTISIYSDIPIVALHEGGHARDTARDEHKGSYAFLRVIPFYSLRDEAVASTDALTFVVDNKKDKDLEKSAYKMLYPAYGTYIGGQTLAYFPAVRTIGAIIGAIPGHIIGRYKASKVEDDAAADKGEKKIEVPN